MSKDTNIKWTESTWNPVTGCSKISAGCKNCYALRDWTKLAKVENSVYFGRKFTDVAFHHDRLDQVIKWKRPRKIFVNSMSDLFHEDLDFDTIDKIFVSMIIADWHIYQVLTKRPEIMLSYLKERMPLLKEKMMDMNNFFTKEQLKLNPEIEKFDINSLSTPFAHIWLGTSIENEESAKKRLPLLNELKEYSKVCWVSAEPLLGYFSIKGFEKSVDWLVLGGESGPKARIMEESWVKSFIKEVKELNVPFLFKQWGEYAPVNGKMVRLGVDKAGDLVDGINYNSYPLIEETKIMKTKLK